MNRIGLIVCFLIVLSALTFPGAGQSDSVSGLLLIHARAADENSEVDSVTLFVDGEAAQLSSQAPYRFELNTRTLSSGRHLLWIEAMKNGARIGRSARRALIVDNSESARGGISTITFVFSTSDNESVAATTPLHRHPLRDRVQSRRALAPRAPVRVSASSPSAAKTAQPAPVKMVPPMGPRPKDLPVPQAKAPIPAATIHPPTPPPMAPVARSPARPRSPAKSAAKRPAKSPQPVAAGRPPAVAVQVPRRWLFVAAGILVTLSAAAVIAALGMRARLFSLIGRRRDFLSAWRPVLLDTLTGEGSHDPTHVLRRRMAVRALHQGRADWLTFLHLWNHLHEARKEEARARLNEVAQVIGVPQVALQFVQGNAHEKLMAVATLGNLGAAASLDALHNLANGDDCVLSLAAARALIHINAHEAVPALMSQIRARTDWAPGKVVSILGEAGTDPVTGVSIISAPLAEATMMATAACAPRMIRLLAATGCDSALPTIRELLERDCNEESVVSACLQSLTNAAEVSVIHPLLEHPHPHVRLEAAVALERLGTAVDTPRLLTLLHDQERWVRYRAARGLAQLTNATTADLERLASEQADEGARAALEHVIAERRP